MVLEPNGLWWPMLGGLWCLPLSIVDVSFMGSTRWFKGRLLDDGISGVLLCVKGRLFGLSYIDHG